MATITADELDRRLRNGADDPLVLDIRRTDEFDDWHIPGSENVPVYDDLKSDPETAAAQLDELPRDEEIVTVCAVGQASQTATALLEDRGYEARTLEGGMQGWSRVHRSAPVEADIEGTLVQVARPGTGCLSYVLVSDGEAAVVGASQYLDEYETIIAEYDAELIAVFDTHAHADHVSGGPELAARHGVPYFLHSADDTDVGASHVSDGDIFTVGSVDVEVIHTPGHSPGSVTYAVGGDALVTGDTLFHESVGRVELGIEANLEDTDLAANASTLHESLERLRARPGNPLVLPSHDPGSPEPPVVARMDEVVRRNDDLGRDRESFIATLADVPDQPANFERIKLVNAGAETVSTDERRTLEQGPNNCAAE